MILAAVLIDGVFPPVPGETIVVAASAAAMSIGQPNLLLVALCTAVGAIVGDNLTFSIGRAVGVERFGWMRRRRMRAALQFAGDSLGKRPAVAIVAARYVPIGRVAVNLVAGATGLARRRFVALSVVAGTLWAVHSVLIGTIAGQWFHGNPALGMLVGIVMGVAVGAVIDQAARFVGRRRDRASAQTAFGVVRPVAGRVPQPVARPVAQSGETE